MALEFSCRGGFSMESLHKKILDNIALGVLVVSRSANCAQESVSITIQDANNFARTAFSLGEGLLEKVELCKYLPIVDTELRFGLSQQDAQVMVYDSFENVNYRVLIRNLEQDLYWVELHKDSEEPQFQSDNRQLIQSLKHEILKLISKEAYMMRENEYLKRLLNELPVLVAIKDSNFRYRYANKSFCDLIQSSLKTLIGKTDYDLCTPEEADQFRDLDKTVIESGSILTREEAYTDTDGIRHVLLAKKTPLQDNNGNISIQLVAVDITELKELQQELEEIKAQYEMVADLSRYVVWVMDLNFRHSFISPSIKQFQGYEVDEFLQIDLSKSLTESGMQRAMQVREDIFRWQEEGNFHLLREIREEVLEYYHKDGSVVKGRVLFRVIMDENNNVLGVHGSTIQI